MIRLSSGEHMENDSSIFPIIPFFFVINYENEFDKERRKKKKKIHLWNYRTVQTQWTNKMN